MPGDGEGRAPRCERPGPAPTTTATNGPVIVPDRGDERRRARDHLAGEHRRLGIARLAHQAMPLTRYYRHPRGAFYCTVTEGWRAA